MYTINIVSWYILTNIMLAIIKKTNVPNVLLRHIMMQYLVSTGANIHSVNDYAIRSISNCIIVFRSISNIHSVNDYAIRYASENGHLQVVQYLESIGAKLKN